MCQHERTRVIVRCRSSYYEANLPLIFDSHIFLQTEEMASLIQPDKNVFIWLTAKELCRSCTAISIIKWQPVGSIAEMGLMVLVSDDYIPLSEETDSVGTWEVNCWSQIPKMGIIISSLKQYKNGSFITGMMLQLHRIPCVSLVLYSCNNTVVLTLLQWSFSRRVVPTTRNTFVQWIILYRTLFSN